MAYEFQPKSEASLQDVYQLLTSMHKQRERVVANASKEVRNRLSSAMQGPHARLLCDIAGREHAAGDVQAVEDAVLLVLHPAVVTLQQCCLAVPCAYNDPGTLMREFPSRLHGQMSLSGSIQTMGVPLLCALALCLTSSHA